jgi:dephospho-CoA kinase
MIVVDADEATRIERVMWRDKCSRDEVLRRIQAQMPASEKVKRADFVINNNGKQKALEEKCRFILRLLTTIASSPTMESMN